MSTDVLTEDTNYFPGVFSSWSSILQVFSVFEVENIWWCTLRDRTNANALTGGLQSSSGIRDLCFGPFHSFMSIPCNQSTPFGVLGVPFKIGNSEDIGTDIKGNALFSDKQCNKRLYLYLYPYAFKGLSRHSKRNRFGYKN